MEGWLSWIELPLHPYLKQGDPQDPNRGVARISRMLRHSTHSPSAPPQTRWRTLIKHRDLLIMKGPIFVDWKTCRAGARSGNGDTLKTARRVVVVRVAKLTPLHVPHPRQRHTSAPRRDLRDSPAPTSPHQPHQRRIVIVYCATCRPRERKVRCDFPELLGIRCVL